MFYDYDDRVIYIAGCNFVITSFGQESSKKEVKEESLEEDEDEHLRQEFIKVEGDNIFSSSPEISAIALSHDRKILCAGTLQKNAKLLIWDICSRTKIKSLSLINAYYISYIKFAYDSQHICCTVDF